jgi:gustatory receptor
MAAKFKNWRPFKDLLNPTDIYTAQRPLLTLSLVSGIVPYKVTNNGNSRLKISVFGFGILILHLSLFGFCYVRTITVHESIVSYFFKTEISVLGDTLQLCIGLIGMCTVFLYSLLQRHKFVLWFHLMAKIDEQLKEIGIQTDYQSTLKFIFLVLLVKFIFFNTYLIGSWVLFKLANLSPNYACWIVFFMPHIFISIIVVLFICFIKQMKHRFYLLNKVNSGLFR